MSQDKSSNGASDELHWRETYFILFPQGQRPTMSQVQRTLAGAGARLQLENLAATDDGLFQSMLIESPEDHAAVEVSYETGDAVIQQSLEWAKLLQRQLPAAHLQRLMTSDARLDVAHFERLAAGATTEKPPAPSDPWQDDDYGADDFGDDLDAGPELGMLDPTCLLIVVEALKSVTQGLAFDPAAGEVM